MNEVLLLIMYWALFQIARVQRNCVYCNKTLADMSPIIVSFQGKLAHESCHAKAEKKPADYCPICNIQFKGWDAICWDDNLQMLHLECGKKHYGYE